MIPANHSNTSEHQIVNLAIRQFNFTCGVFTTAMAIKYQLEQSLFSGQYFFKEDDNLVRVNSQEDIRNLTSTLEHLQTLTNILQEISVS